MVETNVGAARKRVEDPRLLRGEGAYVDDLRQADCLHAAFVRSPHPHARILGIDAAPAKRVTGVVGVFIGADITCRMPPAQRAVPEVLGDVAPPLATDTVRFVGEPVAVVVAESRYAAEDGAALVDVEYDPLPGVGHPEAALMADAPQLHADVPGNVSSRVHRVWGDVDGAFSRAAHRVSVRAEHHRISGVPMEPRGLMAVPGDDGSLTIWASSQAPHRLRQSLAAGLGLDESRIRVIAPDVGGGFGLKGSMYRDDLVVAALALKLGRPVKWIATRIEDMLTTQHAREEIDEAEAAIDAEGRILALRVRTIGNLGAYIHGGNSGAFLRIGSFGTGAYRIDALETDATAVFTNTNPVGAYRGAGRPEAAFIVERVIGEAARKLGIDPAEIRRRNFVQPDQFPYNTPSGTPYDSGNYPRLLATALSLANYDALLRERDERRARGEIVGVGLTTFIEQTGAGGESGAIRIEPDGTITATVGSSTQGQGHKTMFAQIVADRFGVPFEQVRIRQGDTSLIGSGTGTFGSRSTVTGGGALVKASDETIARALDLAAHELEVSRSDVEWHAGTARVIGASDRSLDLAQLAASASREPHPQPHHHTGEGEPMGASVAPLPVGAQRIAPTRGEGPSLGADVWWDSPLNGPTTAGAYVALVSIDRDTGRLAIERFTVVDDCGVVVNPTLALGQRHGALAQGLGEGAFERMVYAEDGQPLSASLLDYALPTAWSIPNWEMGQTVTPSPINELGVKGIGEAGPIGVPPTLVSAVLDALSPFGVTEIHPPLHDEKLWRAIHAAQPARSPSTVAEEQAALRLVRARVLMDDDHDGLAINPADPHHCVGELLHDGALLLQRSAFGKLHNDLRHHVPQIGRRDVEIGYSRAVIASHAPLVGRQRELDAVLRQWSEAARGTIRVVLVDGEPGIGKSRLLQAVAERTAQDGAAVLRGGSSEAAGMPPYLPFLEALGEYVLAADAATLRAQAGPLAPVLATILPELVVRLGDLPSSYVLPPEQARLRLFEAVDRFLGSIAAEQPVLLLLDDLQWADPATLELLCHIARRQRAGSPVLIVGAYRTGELQLSPALRRAAIELNRLRVATTVAVERLTLDDVARMADAHLGGPLAPAAIQPLFTHSEGNPFFVEELLLGWLERGVLVRRTGQDGGPLYDLTPSVSLPLPPGIVSAVGQRLERLPAEVVDLLRVAAVVGRTFAADLLAAVVGLSLDEVDERLSEAARRQLIRLSESGGYAFSHDKIRECLYHGVTPSRLRRLHELIGEALERDAARTGARLVSDLAFHFARAGDAVRGTAHAIGAAEDAMRSFAPVEAAAHFQTALALIPADDARRGATLAGLGDALLLAGAVPDAVAAFDGARAWFEAAGDQAGAGRAALSIGRAWWRLEQIDRARAALEEAAALLAPTPGPDLIAALIDLGSLLAGALHRHDDGIAHTRRALALATSSGDERLAAAGTRSLGNLLVRSNDLATGIALLEEALSLATALGDPVEAAECCAGLSSAFLWQGSARRSREVTLRRLTFAERCHDLYQLRHIHSWLAFASAFLGLRAEVDEQLERAQTVTDGLGSPEPRAFLHFVRGVVALNRSEPTEAEAHLHEAMAIFRAIGPDALVWYLPCLGLAQALQGHADDARACAAEAESLLARVPGTTMAAGDPLIYLVLIDLALGERDRLRIHLPRLAAFAGQFHDMLADRVLGETALALGDRDGARRYLRAAERLARAEGLALELARILESTATLVQQGAAQAGVPSVRELLEEALGLYQGLEIQSEAARLQQRIETLSQQTVRRSRPAGLTGREVQVLALVAGGLSNRQIADALTVSEKTVENHLTSVYGKIGAENRAAATAFAVRHGLV
jgi:carbon-monoxide dehydrogenase large subunit